MANSNNGLGLGFAGFVLFVVSLEDKVDSKAFLEDYFGMVLTIKKK